MIHLLPDGRKRFRANLHCHSTFSDGDFTPEQIKTEYMKRGYSIVAFTDHNRYFSHPELTDSTFLALYGFETDISDRTQTNDNNFVPCYHFCSISKDGLSSYDVPALPAYRDGDGVNEYIARLKDDGFLVAYNHPFWSLQCYDDYKILKGLYAMEIFNYSAYIDGVDGNQTSCYNDMLRLGNRLSCIMTDDNHDRKPIGSPYNDSFGGYTVIYARSLNYGDVTDALEKGEFYCSMGPEIFELRYESGKVSIVCSPAQRISFSTLGRRGGVKLASPGGTVTCAEFDVFEDDRLFMLEIVAPDGKRAHTNAYYVDELNG